MFKDTSSRDTVQIPFTQELWRKGTHLGALIIPGVYFVLGLSESQMLAIMIPIALLMLLIDISRLREWALWRKIAAPIGGRMIRGHEQAGDFTGATYILVSVCLTVAMYTKPIAIAALTFIIVGDTLAALVGRRFGRHRFGRKSVEGSLACLAGTSLVAVFTPGLALSVALPGAVVAAITEALSTRIDDNISVPIVSGLVMTLLSRILSTI
jgi:dolichol kinase